MSSFTDTGGSEPTHGSEGSPPGCKYDFDELQQICTLGTGSFGRVKLVHHEKSGDVMALKILQKDTIIEFRQEKNILSEKRLLRECADCPFIINMISTFNFPNKICILMELVQGGELLTHLYDRTDTIPKSDYGGFNVECVQFYLANILLAYEFMHSKDILYRDLKPENILLSNDGYIKLADFGFAKVIPYFNSSNEMIEKTYTIVGSPEYMAPEMIRNLGYNQAVDYWSLGCLLFELIFAGSLFADNDGHALLTQGNVVKSSSESIAASFPSRFKEEHSSLLNLILSLLEHDPSKRLRFKDMDAIKSISIFSSQMWTDIQQKKMEPVYKPSIKDHLDHSNFFNFEDEEEEEIDYEGSQEIFEKF